MADGGEIAALFATLGLRVNQGQWTQGTAQIGQAQAVLGRFTAGAGAAGKALGGVPAAANQAGTAAAAAGHQAAGSWDAAGAAIKGYLLYLGGHFGYEHLIKFNQEMQDATISLAAMIEGQLGGSFQQATGHAKELYAEWQKFSTQTPVTTAEIVEFGKNIAAATFNAGGKLDDLRQITEQGVIAAKVLAGNRNAGYAALEISEMLSGNVSNRMMFVKQLLGMVKMTEEQFRELDNKGRLAVVKKALGSDAFKDAAQAFGQSFSGVTSTLKDKLQIAAGKIGMPLFERLIETVARFNQWLDDHGPDIERYGKIISDVLASAFDFLSEAIGYVIDKGSAVMEWIGQFVDGSELLKSALTAIGIVLTVFAVQSAIAFATNPITLVILAITALVYGLRKLMAYPGGVKQAFSDAWEAIKRGAEDLFNAIMDGISGAFDYIENIPPIKALVALVEKLEKFTGLKPPTTEQAGDIMKKSVPANVVLHDLDTMSPEEFRKKYPWLPAVEGGGQHKGPTAGDPELQPDRRQLFAPPAAGSGPTVINVGGIGDIHVNAPNADPVAVGDQVRKVFHEELGNTLRKATDVYG